MNDRISEIRYLIVSTDRSRVELRHILQLFTSSGPSDLLDTPDFGCVGDNSSEATNCRVMRQTNNEEISASWRLVQKRNTDSAFPSAGRLARDFEDLPHNCSPLATNGTSGVGSQMSMIGTAKSFCEREGERHSRHHFRHAIDILNT